MPKWPWPYVGLMMEVQSGTPLHALRVLLKGRDSARRRGDYYEVLSLPGYQEEEPPIPVTSNYKFVTPFACKLLPEQGIG
jgi:hypothetical protein